MIVLAGGLDTRLKTVLPDLPKCLAPVNGRPFLEYLLIHFRKQGIERFIFALGHKAELVEQFVTVHFNSSEYTFSVEQEPLGTGGAIYQACGHVNDPDVLVINADTFFAVNLKAMSEQHRKTKADCTLALKSMKRFDRYGSIKQNALHRITGFHEKRFMEEGLINGGIYALHVPRFISNHFPKVFSFEKDYLEKQVGQGKIYGMVSEGWFIDIGIPEDYQRAQQELLQHINDGI